MRVVYFDCFAGISGDMTLGALVDIGVDIASLRHELSKLPLSNYILEAHTVKRGGFRSTHVRVLVDEMAQSSRRYTDIVRMLAESTLDSAVQESALEVFRRLGEVEARLHDEPLETIHFHEVGAVDSIVDVVGAVIGLQALGADLVLTSPINTGYGSVHAAHELLPVPAPATLELLKGFPAYAGIIRKEMTTPTRAALITTLASQCRPLPLMRVEHIGYGAGTRNPGDMPNMLRLIVGELEEDVESPGASREHSHEHPHAHPHAHHHAPAQA